LAYIDTCAERFPIECVLVDNFPAYGSSHLNEGTVRAADLSRPILLAEIAPGRFNVIDGNHRLARARRESVQMVPARRVRCPDHVPFLISDWAYEKYVEYWNSKLEDLSQAIAAQISKARPLGTNSVFFPYAGRPNLCAGTQTPWTGPQKEVSREKLTNH
jgi:hypothetical protein